jgi:demethylspheroidene O-methyltransferase
VRREGEALFDLLAGFCHSQILMALVQFNIPQRLMAGPAALEDLATYAQVPQERMLILLRAGVSLGLLKQRRGAYRLNRRGAALVGVPGLSQMIRHHDVLYRDLADPVAFFRGETVPELAEFWPYVFGGDVAPDVAQTYSDLMAESQVLVVEDTLRAASFNHAKRLLDVGGGTGAFLEGVGRAHGHLDLTLFDLPPVVPAAKARFQAAGLAARSRITAGSFRDDPLPEGADMISLVRVLYDHSDETVRALLAKVYAALPEGGRLLISEPMLGGAAPARPGDAYFALYTLAMGTGKTRSPAEIEALCIEAGFEDVRIPRAARPFVTQVLTAKKPL